MVKLGEFTSWLLQTKVNQAIKQNSNVWGAIISSSFHYNSELLKPHDELNRALQTYLCPQEEPAFTLDHIWPHSRGSLLSVDVFGLAIGRSPEEELLLWLRRVTVKRCAQARRATPPPLQTGRHHVHSALCSAGDETWRVRVRYTSSPCCIVRSHSFLYSLFYYFKISFDAPVATLQ